MQSIQHKYTTPIKHVVIPPSQITWEASFTKNKPVDPQFSREICSQISTSYLQISAQIANWPTRIVGLIAGFGSARLKEGTAAYTAAREFGRLAAKHGLAGISGAGDAIMEAFNRGVFEAGGLSMGCKMLLPWETKANGFMHLFTQVVNFAARKLVLEKRISGLGALPGGFGTLDELFEFCSLKVQGRLGRSSCAAPIVLVGGQFWKEFFSIFRNKEIQESFFGTGKSAKNVFSCFRLVESPAKALKIILECISKTKKKFDYEFDKKQLGQIHDDLEKGMEVLSKSNNYVTLVGGCLHKGRKAETVHQACALAEVIATDLILNGMKAVMIATTPETSAVKKTLDESGFSNLYKLLNVRNKSQPGSHVHATLNYSFTSKILATKYSHAVIALPGDWHVLEYVCELITMYQTEQLSPQRCQLILVGNVWEKVMNHIHLHFEKYGTASSSDRNLYRIAKTPEEAIRMAQRLQMSAAA